VEHRGPRVGALSGPSSTEEGKASAFLKRGSLAAIAGSVVALGGPVALLALTGVRWAGLSRSSSSTYTAEGLLVVAGAVLLLIALLLYRRAFVHLKHVDPRLKPVALLCLVGSAGAIVLVVVGAIVASGPAGLAGCLGGHPTHLLGCLRSKDPTAGYLSVVGFWLLWAGAAGLAAGLIVSGRHFGRPAMTAGGIVYAVLAAELVEPFAALVVPLALTAYAVGAAPVAAVTGATLVYLGARSGLRRDG